MGIKRKIGIRYKYHDFEIDDLVTSSPSIKICPEVGFSKPATKRNTVVLPQPDGPNKVTIVPRLMVKSKLSMTVDLPKDLVIFF